MPDFTDLPLFNSEPAEPAGKLAMQWHECKQKNPDLLPSLARLARELRQAGHKRYSMDGLFHILRWETRASTEDLGLKINNNYTAFASRDVMKLYPDLEGFFKLRKQYPRSSQGQIH